jgi:hypothetical protein
MENVKYVGIGLAEDLLCCIRLLFVCFTSNGMFLRQGRLNFKPERQIFFSPAFLFYLSGYLISYANPSLCYFNCHYRRTYHCPE